MSKDEKEKADQKSEQKPVGQKPSVGRIVHYTPAAHEGKPVKGQPYPAMITHVHDDDCVNLSVHNDAEFGLIGGDTLKPRVSVGTGPGTWSWPPRV